MNAIVARAVRRNGHRIRNLIAPVMLVLGLSGFALAQMPYANTSWTQDLVLKANLETAEYTPTPTETPVPTPTESSFRSGGPSTVGGGACLSTSACPKPAPAQPKPANPNGGGLYTCEPLALDTAAVRTVDGATEYRYRLTGGSARPREGCPDAVAVIVPVCFNASTAPGGLVAVSTNAAASWTYAGHMEDPNASPPQLRAVEWSRAANVSGPFSAALTFTIPGVDHPVERTTALVRDAGGATYALGEVTVPRPAACDALPVAPAAPEVEPQPTALPPAPTATPEPPTVEPTEAPAPEETPTPVPEPTKAPPRATPTATPFASGGVVWWD